jgi:hypothetical protein
MEMLGGSSENFKKRGCRAGYGGIYLQSLLSRGEERGERTDAPASNLAGQI